MNGNDIVAEFIRTLSWDHLPAEVRQKAKLCLLDGLGAAITGTLAPITGIADYNAPNLPMMRDIDHPTMVKHGIGWGALTGIMSAGLAANGFTAVPSLLGHAKYHDWVATIGREYLMVERFETLADMGPLISLVAGG